MCVGAAGRGSEPQCSQQPTAPKPVRAKGRTRHCSIPLQPQGTKPQPSSAQSWGASAAREADPASKKEPGKAAQCITACLYTREFGFRCIQQENGGGGGGCKIAAQFARGWRTAHVHRDCCQTGSRVGGLGGGRGVAWHSTQVATMLLDVSARPRASLRKVGRGGDDEKSSMLGARKKSLCKISRQTSFELLLSKPPGGKGSHRCHPIHVD